MEDIRPPALLSIGPVLALSHLVRLTLSAGSMPDEVCVALVSAGRCPSLRCFHMENEACDPPRDCPQSDDALRFFIRPPPGWTVFSPATLNEQRGGVWKRNSVERRWQLLYSTYSPATFPFPALECLALPYVQYKKSVSVSKRHAEGADALLSLPQGGGLGGQEAHSGRGGVEERGRADEVLTLARMPHVCFHRSPSCDKRSSPSSRNANKTA